MKVGIIGLGKMGEAIAYRAMQKQHEVIGFDVNSDACNSLRNEGVTITDSIADVASQQLDVVWLMVPHGTIIDTIIDELIPHLIPHCVVVDGGNSKFTDSIRRAKKLIAHNIIFLDCGTSGGLHGREKGFCLMIGGDVQGYTKTEPLFAAIAAPQGYAHIGPSGAGHYVKMVHNGIEYALLQAYSEGFNLLKEGTFKDINLDVARIAQLWNHGAIIRSWILELVHTIFEEGYDLTRISGKIESTGMGEWTVQEAHAHNIPTPTIEISVDVRTESKKTGGNYGTKIVALLRHAFGGHTVKKITDKE